ncbi:MAG: hypothetical protein BGO98_27440 [Myxococcales bacterium 68-20]|nr:hypothetical protein [Myxococcales bacterium]OJY30456.1 MAG: hypothetical protein BGO98_27440 [Myxococcales bacterium 68-20]
MIASPVAARVRTGTRATARGAILVEAIVVISFFITCFIGVVYFRALYVQKLHLQRLARSAAIAHAMGACASDPRAAIERDVGARRLEGRTESGIPFDAIPTVPALPHGENGATALARAREKNGDSGLDQITVVRLEGDASATTRGPDGREAGYRSTPSSTSYVVCADEAPDDRYEGIVEQIANLF